jgi:hypothetical protein
VCRAALQSWQAEAALVVGSGDSHVRHELAYYTTQVEHWQGYLEHLQVASIGAASVPVLIRLIYPRAASTRVKVFDGDADRVREWFFYRDELVIGDP